MVAIPIGLDGTLYGGATIATGGKGGTSVTATGALNAPDTLSSQSALTVVGDVSKNADSWILIGSIDSHFSSSVPVCSQCRIEHPEHDEDFKRRPDRSETSW